jgi:hypothetical protein
MSQIKSIGRATNLCKPARTGHQSAQAEFTHLRESASADRFGIALNSPSRRSAGADALPKRHRTRRSCALVENARRIGDWRYMSQIKSIGLAMNLCKPERTGHQSAQAEFTHLRASERIPIRSNRGCAPNSLILRMSLSENRLPLFRDMRSRSRIVSVLRIRRASRSGADALPKRHRTRRSCALVENARRIGDWRYMSQIKSIGLAMNLRKPARTGHQSVRKRSSRTCAHQISVRGSFRS